MADSGGDPAKPEAARFSGRAISVVMLLSAGITFGLMFTLNKIATADIPFIAYVFWQATGAAALLTVISVAQSGTIRVDARLVRASAAFGLAGFALPYLVLNYVAPRLPAGVVGLVMTLVPMLTYAFAIVVGLDRLKTFSVFGLLLGLAGVLLIIVPDTSLPSPRMAGYFIIALLVPAIVASSNIIAKLMRPPDTSSVTMAAGGLIAAAVYLLPVFLLSGDHWPAGSMLGDEIWIVAGAILVNVIFFCLLFEIIRREGPVFFGTQNYINSLAGIGWGIVLLGEEHSSHIFAALGLLFAGLYLVLRDSRNHQDRPQQ